MTQQSRSVKRLGPDVSYYDINLERRLRNIENALAALKYANNVSGLNDLDPNNKPRVADPELSPPAPTGLELVSNIETITISWNEVNFGNLLDYEVVFPSHDPSCKYKLN